MNDKIKHKKQSELRASRKNFIKMAGTAIAMLTAARLGLRDMAKVQAAAVPPPGSGDTSVRMSISEDADILLLMQEELKVALQKPVEERHWHMVIDLRKCVGCSACTIACVSENKLPPGVVYRPVLDEEIGIYPNVTRRFTPRPCMHCDNPPCTDVCPVSATWKQADGTVVVDYKKCIGCRYCIAACPYAARTFDFGDTYTSGTAVAAGLVLGKTIADDYERVNNFEYGKKWPRIGDDASPIGNVRKCQFCEHRLANRMLPACVTTCIGRATYFGDANNPDSLVSRLISKPNVMRLKEDIGTEPSVYYLL